LCDRHRLKAMAELLKLVDYRDVANPETPSLQNIINYTDLFRMLLMKMKNGVDSRIKLDRFLKAYGNRAAYPIKNRKYQTIAPTITEASWTSPPNSRFDLSQIKLRSNADILFSCLLQSLERDEEMKTTMTISEIIDRIPVGSGGVCNPASYKYALISLFGKQKERDYFVFDEETKSEFTKQANQSTRDMGFFKKHLDVQVTIQKKFLIAINH
jgi:hypothetical protein